MKVKALKSFSGTGFHVPEGTVFELPEGVDWLKAGLVEPVAAPLREKKPTRKAAPRRRKRTVKKKSG